MLRLFLALDLDAAFLDGAAALIERLRRGGLSRARWVPRDALHLTLRFLGDADEALVPALGALVGRIGASRRAIDLRAPSLLAFPEARRARILGLRLEDDDAIAGVAADVEGGVVALGFSPEERPLRAHVTLARLREPTDLRRAVAGESVSIAGHAASLTLYRSELGRGPPRYAALARARLGA